MSAPPQRGDYVLRPPAMTGYSDRINHALAFAAKHHDREVRKGARAPYLTQPANVAIILTRYGRDDDTIVAGILLDFVDDCVRQGWSRETIDERLAEKFGPTVLETALSVTRRRVDDGGVEFSREESRADHLERLGRASEAGLWVCAADTVHQAGSILADLRRTIEVDSVWGRFTGGRDATVRWFGGVRERFAQLGFRTPIAGELSELVAALEKA